LGWEAGAGGNGLSIRPMGLGSGRVFERRHWRWSVGRPARVLDFVFERRRLRRPGPCASRRAARISRLVPFGRRSLTREMWRAAVRAWRRRRQPTAVIPLTGDSPKMDLSGAVRVVPGPLSY
jgi:hypothetical protein